MSPSLEIIIIGCLVASSAAIPGVFLVLRRVAMMSDAISHSVLLGIVILFFITKDIHSPLLVISAAVTGLATVALTELLIYSKRLKKDAAIGLIFPIFFSLAIVLINRYAANIHLDQDAVLLGEIAFAPFNRLIIKQIDLGPIALWVMSSVALLNSLFIGIFYKELKLSTFDASLASSMGFSPILLHYGLMSCVSITAVTAFDTVGAILVVAFMITPPATAYLLTTRLSRMIIISIFIGCLSAICGYALAAMLDASIAGSMATMTGFFFILALLFSKEHGILYKIYTFKTQKIKFASTLLVIQLLHHENTKTESFENSFTNLISHMNWQPDFAKQVISYALSKNLIIQDDNHFSLNSLGREIAKNSIIKT